MTRRRWLWILGVASVALFAVLAALDAKLVDEGGWGIVDFELAGSREDARRMVADWGAGSHDAALASLWLDYLYMAAYGAFGVLAVAALRDVARRRGWRRLGSLGGVVVAFPALAAGFDALENAGLLLTLGDHGGSAAPVLATAFAVAKFLLMSLALLYGLAVLVVWGWNRRRVATAVVLGVAVAIAVAVVAVGIPATGETKAAEPSMRGQIVRVPGGDLYVEDTGQGGVERGGGGAGAGAGAAERGGGGAGAGAGAAERGSGQAGVRGDRSSAGRSLAPRDAAIVLIHGYTGSTRWWSRVVPALSERRRVIAVDLLGHGRSEKPRSGYSMENQAGLVLGALRRLGVRRAVVVGHSMGGWVAVAMAERDPRLVRGVAVIGTPADRPEGPGPFGDRLGYLPVLGGALWKGVPDSYVRSELKSAFADGVAVPDAFVEDTKRLNWHAYADSARESRDYREDRAPYVRVAAARIPFLAILGTEDERAKAHTTREWDLVPGGRVVRMRGVGHTPPWERPGPTAAELARFADPLLR